MLEEGRAPRALRRRSNADVLLDQLRGVEAWTREHIGRAVEVDDAVSRESRLDLARRRDVVMRQRQALFGWTERQLRESDRMLSFGATRVAIAHRHDWFKGKLASGLQAGGARVVADVENGADALGVVIAEQPDFLILEDRLPMLSGLELTGEVCRYAPGTVVVVQVTNSWETGAFLEAGATAVYTRRTPPADIAAELLEAVAG